MRTGPNLTRPPVLLLALAPGFLSALPHAAVAESAAQPQVEAPAPAWPPNFSRSVQGSGLPGVDGGHVFLWNRPQGFDPASTLRVDRHVPEGSGEADPHLQGALGARLRAGRTMPATSGRSPASCTTAALASTGAQNVAVNGTVFKEANGLGPVGPSWAGNFNCVDTTDEADPVASCIGAEIDVSAQSPTTDRNRQRVGLQISTGGVAGRPYRVRHPDGQSHRLGHRPGHLVPGGGRSTASGSMPRRPGSPACRSCWPRAIDRPRRHPRGRLLAQPRLRRARPGLRDRERPVFRVSDAGQIEAASRARGSRRARRGAAVSPAPPAIMPGTRPTSTAASPPTGGSGRRSATGERGARRAQRSRMRTTARVAGSTTTILSPGATK